MRDTQIFSYRIPDKFFLPHKVTIAFYAKVIYSVTNGQHKIEEVGLSLKCLEYINNPAGMKQELENDFEAAIRKAKILSGINQTIAAALAPHI